MITVGIICFIFGFLSGILSIFWFGSRLDKMRVPKPLAAQVLSRMTDEFVAQEGQRSS